MKINESKIIKDRSRQLLTAYGYKIKMTLIKKAAKSNGFDNWMMKGFKPMKETLETAINSLIFDHNITAEQLSELNNSIKVIDNKIYITTSEIFRTK